LLSQVQHKRFHADKSSHVFVGLPCAGLKLGTEYEMLVVAKNALGENEAKMKSIKAMTSGNASATSSNYF